jgi:hypothetical protein
VFQIPAILPHHTKTSVYFPQLGGWEADAVDEILGLHFGGLGLQHSAVKLPQPKAYAYRGFMQHVYFPDSCSRELFDERSKFFFDLSKEIHNRNRPVRTASDERLSREVILPPYYCWQGAGA